MKISSKSCLLCVAALPAVPIAAPVSAQAVNQSSPDTPAPADSASLEEIIVTATRAGETNLQKTPIAVTAFNPRALADRGVTTALDLNGLAPNVSIGSRSGDGATAGGITIRGIGTDANAPAQPGVGIYVDDVYIPAQFGNLLGTYDLSQVEILRGPAGTIFGRNTIGGAVQYTSVRPEIGQLSGFAEGTIGNQKHYDGAGGLNVPLADWAALRVSGAHTSIDGYVRDLTHPGVYRGSEDNDDVRVQLRLRPTSDLTIDLKAERLTQQSNGPAVTQVAFNPTAAFFAPPLLGFVSPDFYTTYGPDGKTGFHSNLKIGQGVITYALSPNIGLKSITAYSRNTDHLDIDSDGTPFPAFTGNRGNDLNKLFTQEFQLTGKSFSNRLRWTLGLYYYAENSSNTDTSASIFGTPLANTTYGDYDEKTKSYAGYGQATFDLTSRLSIVGGLRYTKEDIDASDVPGATTPPVIPPGPPLFVSPGPYPGPYRASASYNNWSPLVGLNYQLSQDILFYAKWSRGFRAGGFSPNLFSANAYGPETAGTYEVGTRMEFLDHRLRINPTAFLTDWKNIQFNAIAITAGGPAPIVQNAGNARAKGLELESQFAVTKRFTITANGALFEGHYTFIAPGIAVTSSTPLKRAPGHSYSIGGRYEVPVGDGNIALNMNYTRQAKQRSTTSDTDNVNIPAYGLLNGRLVYTSPKDLYAISLWANNLTNEKYLIGGVDFGKGGAIPTTENDPGRPREFGITVRFNLRR